MKSGFGCVLIGSIRAFNSGLTMMNIPLSRCMMMKRHPALLAANGCPAQFLGAFIDPVNNLIVRLAGSADVMLGVGDIG